MNTIILFYKYVHIPGPKKILVWQKTLCTELGLKGSVILALKALMPQLGGLA